MIRFLGCRCFPWVQLDTINALRSISAGSPPIYT